MGSNLYHMLLRGAPLSVPTGNTHAPEPGGLPTGCSRYLPPWPLCMVCAKTRVNNLLNRTLPVAGTSGSTNTYGGYRNKTRSTVDSGGSSIPCMISITNIFHPTESPLISPYHAIPDITVPTETGDKLTPTQGRGFPGFLSGMHARHMRMITITGVFISNTKEITNMHSCK